MPIGEGGIITTHNVEMADKIKYLLMHGMNRDAWKRYSEAGSWYYEVIDPYNILRREYGEKYDQAFRSLPGIQLHGLDPWAY